jgi:hypothetical protein
LCFHFREPEARVDFPKWREPYESRRHMLLWWCKRCWAAPASSGFLTVFCMVFDGGFGSLIIFFISLIPNLVCGTNTRRRRAFNCHGVGFPFQKRMLHNHRIQCSTPCTSSDHVGFIDYR